MKRKIFSILFALVLVLGLSLVTAVPVGANGVPTTFNVLPFTLGGGAAWSTDQDYTGTHSVKLLASGDYVDFVPPAGTTLDDLSTITTGWGWWYRSDSIGPGLELRFEGPNFGTVEEHVDITVNTAELSPVGTGTWTEVPVTSTSTATCYGNDSTGDAFADSFAPGETWVCSTGNNPLADIVTIVTGYTGLADAGDWPLTRVRAEIYASGTVYIDDIEIAGTTYYGLFQDVIDVATTGDNITVAAGTYDAETTWPIAVSKELTIQSVSGNATTIIAPGAAGQGVIAITADNVTIDGFTITHGTESYTPSAPVENTIWVDAEYSTIKNNIITGAGGTAGIYIGGRTDPADGYAKWVYATGQPLGHIIQDNAIDNRGSGEGWGIFAVELTDSLIHGNSFTGSSDVGDGRATPWNTTAGTPGTCIIIHSATAGTAAGSPGGGDIIVEDNTASWVKYTFMNFVAGVMVADVDGKFYEKAVAGTVDDVIVRNNTVTNVGKNSTDYSSGNIVNFSAESKTYDGTKSGASLTIGSNKVTIGPGNTFQTADSIIKVKDPKEDAATTKFGVLNADNIVVKYNNFAGAESYGIYNGTTHVDQDSDGLGGDKVIVATYNWWGTAAGAYHATTNPGVSGKRGATVTNSVTYIPWLFLTTEANDGDTIANIVANEVPAYAKAVVLSSGWNTFSVPIGLDGQYNNWDELVTLTSANYSLAYRFNPTTQEFESLATTDTDAVAPGEGFYVKMNEAGSLPYCYSTVVTIPSRALGDGWNFIGGGMTAQSENLTCVSIATVGSTAGYTHIVSPAQNAAGSWVFIAGASTEGDFELGEGYWVFLPIDRTLGLFDLTPVTWVP